jgi:hypothetical protein
LRAHIIKTRPLSFFVHADHNQLLETELKDDFSNWAQNQDLYKLYECCFWDLAKDWSAAERGMGGVNALIVL